MTLATGEGQLEFFDLNNPSSPRPPREHVGRMRLQLRYDQLALCTIASLIGVAIVFACGVERGKQLVRSERSILARQPSQSAPAASASPVEAVSRQISAVKSSAKTEEPENKSRLVPTPVPKKSPSKLASSKLRYAIQLVTFSRPQLAKQEMERLKTRGERVFLVMREGRTTVYAGPFPSKVNAKERLVMLRTHYQDCFMKIL